MNIMIKGKSLFGFKYIRFKFSSQSAATELKSKDVLHMRTSKLAELLDCTNYTAREIISRNGNLLSTGSFEFVQNAKFCGEFLKLSDVVEFPCLLTLNPSLLQHRYFSLQELGCSNISGSSILRYPQLVKKSPKELESEGLHFSLETSLEKLGRFVREDRDDFVERLRQIHGDGHSLQRLKEAANAELFAAELGCSVAVTHHMFRIYPPLRIQSTANTLKVFRVLLERFHFPTSKVCYSPRVLSLHHEALGQFLDQLPSMLGVDSAKLAIRFPLLLRRPYHTLKQVEQVLREGGVKGEQLLCCPKAAGLCPRTLRQRLRALDERAELAPFRPHRRFLWLAYYFGRLEARLKALREADAPPSITAFTATEDKFERSLLFGCSRVCSWRVEEFLRSEGLSEEQLLHGLDVMELYDEATVQRHWAELRARPDWPEWASHHNLLHLLAYNIEHGSKRAPFKALQKVSDAVSNATRMRFCCDAE